MTLTFIQYRIGISTISALFGYDSPIVVFQAITMFNILKNINIVQIKKLIYAVGNNSFCIYIVHIFFVNFFYKALHINPLKNTWGVLLIILVLINFGLSYLCTAVLKRLPIFKRLL